MKNIEIIATECVLNNITEDVDTFAGWKRRGRCVKKGETALFKTSIWKPKTKKQIEEEEESDDEKKSAKRFNRMVMVPAAFFGLSQTEVLQTS